MDIAARLKGTPQAIAPKPPPEWEVVPVGVPEMGEDGAKQQYALLHNGRQTGGDGVFEVTGKQKNVFAQRKTALLKRAQGKVLQGEHDREKARTIVGTE